MKIRPEHLAYLKSKIDALSPSTVAFIKESIRTQNKYKDFGTRLRFDLLYASVPSSWICDNLYPYMNDDHINSALKAVVKEV